MKVDVSRLKEDFRKCNQQVELSSNQKVDFHRGYDNKPKNSSDGYSQFLKKYADLRSTVDSFTTRDLMYFFREKANEAGVRYVIANIKRDMAVFKKLKSNYSNREICLMIEFIFNSPQNYLDISSTQPTVLISSWCNTLYKDSIAWANDRYVPYSKKKADNRVRECTETTPDVKVGEWE